MAPIDVRSADIVLTYVAEDERGGAGAPPADLSGNDIGRLAYRRAMDALGDRIGRPIDPDNHGAGVFTRPDPEQPDPAIVAELLEELVASGRYEPVAAPKPGPKPRAASTPDETADAAEQPEA